MRESDFDKNPNADAVESFLKKHFTEMKIEGAVVSYLALVEQLGIIQGFVMGSKLGERRGYLWNIFNRDITMKDAENSVIYDLSQLECCLHKSLDSLLPMRISNVSPSNLSKLILRCEELGIETAVEYF